MPRVVDLFLSIDAMAEPLPGRIARELGWPQTEIAHVKVVRRSLDARKRRTLGYQVRVEVTRTGEAVAAPTKEAPPSRWPAGRPAPRIVIVGSGPAGTWAALRLCEAGLPSMIVERGKPVQPRRRSLADLQRGALDPDSNYCFGEGGAGTFSDGKLYTRSKDRVGVARVLADLVRFGAPPDIEIDSRPHVGSNRLPKVLSGVREYLEAHGATYRFEDEVVGFRTERGAMRAVSLRHGGEMPADIVILAAGHSARGMYTQLAHQGVPLERKDFAVGVRLEHPQPVVDRMQYGRNAGDPRLPPAFYEMAASCGGRGVYSFCMCPGGWIVPAATEPGGLVVNGMSLSKRDSPFANSGLVVMVRSEDCGPAGEGPLAGVELQRRIEQAAFRAGGGAFVAPAETLMDFLALRVGGVSLPATSYHPGAASADLRELFPGFVATALHEGLSALGKRFPMLLHPEALLVAAETRTSAPVRILRDPGTLQSPGLAGLYPVGEGAGYAGGIVSAALDGMRAANAILTFNS